MIIRLVIVVFLLSAVQALAQDPAADSTDVQSSNPDRIIHVDRVLIVGNKVTKLRIIERELSLKAGDTISAWRLPETLQWDKNKLYNLRLFNTVSVRALELPNDHMDILVELTERWYIFPTPIFELSDRNFNEWWNNYNHDFSRVNYGLRIYKNNFRGRNETLRLTLQFGFVQKYNLQYRIPNLDRKQKHGITFNFDYTAPRNIAYMTRDHKLVFLEEKEKAGVLKKSFNTGFTYHYRRSFFETHSFGFNYSQSEVSDTILYMNPIYFNNGKKTQRYLSASYSFNSEHRDVVLYPLRGYQFTGFISKTGLLPDDDVNEFEVNVSYARHWPLKSNFYLSNFTSFFWSSPTTQPYAVFNALGYRELIVRGFENYVVEGPSFALNKTTLKKRIFRRVWTLNSMPIEQFNYFPLAIYLKVFADFGYVQNYPYYEKNGYNGRYANNLLHGVGGGVDIVTLYDLVVRVEYTWAQQNAGAFFLSARKEF